MQDNFKKGNFKVFAVIPWKARFQTLERQKNFACEITGKKKQTCRNLNTESISGVLKFHCTKKFLKKSNGKILRDDIVILENKLKRNEYPDKLRRITAIIEIDGKEKEMTFFTNNMEWAPSSICDLYKSRWSIETFFKQIKQTLKLGGFLGHNKNAIQWQVWTALLMYILLRFLHACSNWSHSFTRLFTCLRAVLWQRRNLIHYLNSYGTAGGSIKLYWAPQQAFLPEFEFV